MPSADVLALIDKVGIGEFSDTTDLLNTKIDLLQFKRMKKNGIIGIRDGAPPKPDESFSEFEPFDGTWKEHPIRIPKVQNITERQDGNLIKTGDNIVSKSVDGNVIITKFWGNKRGISMGWDDNDLDLKASLMRAGRTTEVVLDLQKFFATFKNQLKEEIAYAIYNGKGVVNAVGSTTSPYNSNISGATPALNNIEGMMNYLFDPDYDYGGLDISAYPFFRPKVLDFTSGTNADIAYLYTNINTRAKLISATNSTTTNVPCILDIIKRSIDLMKRRYKKPEVGVISQKMFELIQDAKESIVWSSSGVDEYVIKNVMEWMPGRDATVINGVPFIVDNNMMKMETEEDATMIFPLNTIMLFSDVDKFHLCATKDSFKESAVEKVPGVWFQWIKTLYANTLFYVSPEARRGQCIIKLPTALGI